MTPTPCHRHHPQIFDKIDSFLKPVLSIFILCNLILGWGRWLLRRQLEFCIKSIDLRELLIGEGLGFIRIKVGIIQDPFKYLRWNLCENCF